jgi:hypothetical protein
MSFTRFNYDKCRTAKILQESTGPGRYMLNQPGWGSEPCFFDDPHIRMQGWGANLRKVPNNNPIDMDSDLIGITRPLYKNCSGKEYPNSGVARSQKASYPVCKKAITDESRTTHPSWMYRDLEQDHKSILFLDPQEHTSMIFQNNLNTRLLESDNYITESPQFVKESGKVVWVSGKNM